jgi:hypothetical protein
VESREGATGTHAGEQSSRLDEANAFSASLTEDDDRIPFATLSDTDCYISVREGLNGVGRAAAALVTRLPTRV